MKSLINATFSIFILIVFTTSAYPQWVQTNWSESNSFFDLYTNQDMVFTRIWDSFNGGRVFLTSDNGTNWTQISSVDSDIDILSILMWNNNILAGTWDGFYRCTLDDIYWEPFESNGIPADTTIWSTAMIDNTLFAGAIGDIYVSSINDANTWTEVGTGIPEDARITSIVANGNAIFAGSDCNGVFIVTDGETSWTAINSGLTDKNISQLASMGTKLFAVTLKDGVFVSDSNGMNWVSDANEIIWTQDNSGLKNINCLLPINNLLFAGTDSNGVYISNNSGLTWASISSGMPTNTRVWSLAASSDNIFAGTSEGLWWINPADINSFTITANALEGGTISPSGIVMVYEGSSQKFTITPLPGYAISSVTVDENSVGDVSTYTFTDITENHTISVSFVSVPYQINCGGEASSPYIADQYYSGGSELSVTSTINTTGVTAPAPQAVYQTERYGTTTYMLPNLTSGASYKVRLHFSENFWPATGIRKFNVTINGTIVLSNYDIYAETVAMYKAVVKEFTTTANTSGQIVIELTNVSSYATIGGIEIIPQL